MTRRSTSMSLDTDILSKAKTLGINLSQAAENGLKDAIRAEQAKRWKRENAQAIASYNALIAQDGVTLSKHRKF